MAIFGRKVMYNRITILGIVVLFLLSLDVARIFYLQVLKGDEYAAKAESQQLSDTEIPAMRGTIYDSDGNILAQSATVWTVYLDPLNIKEKQRPVLIAELTKLFDLDEEEAKALEEKTRQKNHYVIVREQVENNIKKQLADFIDKQAMANCIGMEQSTKRYYPYGSLASSVIGFTGADDQGLSGLEQNYNDLLTGTPGRLITAKDAKSNSISDDYSTSIAAQDGDSLTLTINQTIQYYLEKGLRETMEQYRSKGAYGVVMDCNTGAVLAMSSMPDYDCNEPYKLTYDKNKKAIKKIKDKTKKSEAESAAVQNQWRNFTVSDTYVPGSVFKTFIASAALEEKVVNLNTSYTCTGSIQVEDYKMNCHYHAGHGTQNLTQGLENSCNPFFITIGQRLGVHNYFKYFQGFGFTDITGIDLPGEASPQYYKEKQYGIVELSSASFGQTNSLTPIQVCTGLCAIANGGTLLKPYVVSEVRDADGKVVQKNSRTAVRQVISEDTSKKVCKMMKAVVDEGTGKNGYVTGVDPAAAASALANYVPAGMRQNLVQVGGVQVIEDCYNASPDSMRAALQTLGKLPVHRRYAVLGAMLELGDYAKEAHTQVGKMAAENGIDGVLAYGADAAYIVEAAKQAGLENARLFDTKEALAQSLAQQVQPGDGVLFKGSRGMHLEDVMHTVYERWEKA